MTYRYVAAHMKRLRERNMLTQSDLAEKLEVDTRTVQRIESGATTPSKKTIRALCEFFKLTPEEILKPLPEEPQTSLWGNALQVLADSDPEEESSSFLGPGSFLDTSQLRAFFSEQWLDVRVRACQDVTSLAEAFGTSEFFRVVPGVELQSHQTDACMALDSLISNVFDEWGRSTDGERERTLDGWREGIDALLNCGLRFAFERIDVDMTSPHRSRRRSSTLLVMTVLLTDETERELKIPAEVWKTLRRDIDVRTTQTRVPKFWLVSRSDTRSVVG